MQFQESMSPEEFQAVTSAVPQETGSRLRPGFSSRIKRGLSILDKVSRELTQALKESDILLRDAPALPYLNYRRKKRYAVELLDLLRECPAVDSRTLTLGLDHDGHPVQLDLSSEAIDNVLVAGSDGAGKTGMLRTMALSLALASKQAQAQMCIIDGDDISGRPGSRRRQLQPLSYLHHLIFPVVDDLQDALESLEFIGEEIDYRQEQEIDSPLLVVLIDNVDELIWKGGRPALDALSKLLQAGATCGLRMILSTKDPATPELLPLLKHNVSLRLLGRMDSREIAYAAAGRSDVRPDLLKAGGEFIAITAHEPVHFRAAYIDDDALYRVLERLHRARRPVLYARAVSERQEGARQPPASSTGPNLGQDQQSMPAKGVVESSVREEQVVADSAVDVFSAIDDDADEWEYGDWEEI